MTSIPQHFKQTPTNFPNTFSKITYLSRSLRDQSRLHKTLQIQYCLHETPISPSRDFSTPVTGETTPGTELLLGAHGTETSGDGTSNAAEDVSRTSVTQMPVAEASR